MLLELDKMRNCSFITSDSTNLEYFVSSWLFSEYPELSAFDNIKLDGLIEVNYKKFQKIIIVSITIGKREEFLKALDESFYTKELIDVYDAVESIAEQHRKKMLEY